MMEKHALEQGLRQFHGSERVTRHALMSRMLMTEGILFLREHAEAYWLVDAIASHLMTNRKLRMEPFQVWTFQRNGEDVALPNRPHMLTAANGHDGSKPIASQEIELTDFPLDEIKLFAEFDGEAWILMLPGER